MTEPTATAAQPFLAAPPRRRVWPDRALLRTLLLSAGLAAGALLGLVLLAGEHQGPVGNALPWWFFALAFAAAELLVFDVELQRERTNFTLAEVPLVVGLFAGNPLPVLVGRLIGELLVLVLHERQIARKLVLNLSIFAGECVIAFLVFDLVTDTPDITNERSWGAALLAAIAADTVSMSCLSAAKRFHGAPVALVSLVRTNILTLVTSTGLALTALLLVEVRPLALVPLGAVVAMVFMALKGYSALMARLDNSRLLYDFTALVAGKQQSREVVETLLANVRGLLAAEVAVVHLFDEAADGTAAVETWTDAAGAAARTADGPPDLRERLHRFEATAGRGDKALQALERQRELAAALGQPHALAATLHAGEAIIGALVVDSHRVDLGPFDGEDAKLFHRLAGHTGAALDNAKLIDRLREENRRRTHEARHDPLTGLPNRADFDQRFGDALDRARVEQRAIGVGVLDLDRFKEVNDTLGHHIGDMLLEAVADRLRLALGGDAFLARIGGDEFALLVQDVDVRPAALLDLGGRLARAAHEPFELDDFTVRIGTSIGFSRYPVDGTDSASLLRSADAAMYRAKHRSDGGNVEVAERNELSIVELDG